LLGALFRLRSTRQEEREVNVASWKYLEFVELADRAHETASSLSYGEQRRLEIARALATQPRLLLLDEPAAGMNRNETSELMADIVRLKELGRTVLLIEHDMVVIATISDHVIALDHGCKIAEGSFDVVRTNPQVLEAYLGRGAAGTAGDAVGRA